MVEMGQIKVFVQELGLIQGFSECAETLNFKGDFFSHFGQLLQGKNI